MSYHSDECISFTINGYNFDFHVTNAGDPQHSVHTPTTFLLCIDDHLSSTSRTIFSNSDAHTFMLGSNIRENTHRSYQKILDGYQDSFDLGGLSFQ